MTGYVSLEHFSRSASLRYSKEILLLTINWSFLAAFKLVMMLSLQKKTAILADKINIFDTGGRYHYIRRADSLNSTYYSEKKVQDYFAYVFTILEFFDEHSTKITSGGYLAFLVLVFKEAHTIQLQRDVDFKVIFNCRKKLRDFAYGKGYADIADFSDILEQWIDKAWACEQGKLILMNGMADMMRKHKISWP